MDKYLKVLNIIISVVSCLVSLSMILLDILMNGYDDWDIVQFPLIYLFMIAVCFILVLILKCLKVNFSMKLFYFLIAFLNLPPNLYFFIGQTLHIRFGMAIFSWILNLFFLVISIYTIYRIITKQFM